jgi:hypothetical protein
MSKRFGLRGYVGLTTIVAAATVMALMFAGTASADGSYSWNGQNGLTACAPGTQGTMLWIFNPHSEAVPGDLTVDGLVYPASGWTNSGGGQNWHYTIPIVGDFPPESASVDYTGTLGSNPILTISGCNEGGGNTPTAVDPSVTKDAVGSYDNSYVWTIGKTVDKTAVDVTPGTTATFTYTVTVSHDGGTVGNVGVAGTITAINLNAGDIVLSSVTDQLSDLTDCDVDTSAGFTVAAGGTTEYPYTCDLGSTVPTEPITNTAEIDWNHQVLSDSSDLAAGSATFTTDPISFTENAIDECVSVSDSIDPNSPHGFCVGDVGDPTFSFVYSRTVNAPALGTCTSYDNTATFTANDSGATGSDSKRVTACTFNAPLTIGYWKTHMYRCATGEKTGHNGCNSNGPFTNSLLGTSICNSLCVAGKLSGTFTATAANALAVFDANNCANVSTSDSNAAACLAAQLLGAELNVANVANSCICGTIANAIAFLTAVNYNGPGSKVTFNATHTRAQAIALKTALDNYNNGKGCPA